MQAHLFMYLNWRERKEALKEIVYIRVKIKSVELGNQGGPVFFYDYYLNNTLVEGRCTVVNNYELSLTKKLKQFTGDYFYAKYQEKSRSIVNYYLSIRLWTQL